MTVNGDDSAPAPRGVALRQKLITSSTKRRVAELAGLQHLIAADSEFPGRCLAVHGSPSQSWPYLAAQHNTSQYG